MKLAWTMANMASATKATRQSLSDPIMVELEDLQKVVDDERKKSCEENGVCERAEGRISSQLCGLGGGSASRIAEAAAWWWKVV